MLRGFRRPPSFSRVLVAAFIFVFATCSFFGNYFYAANPSWFIRHQLDSEQLVLDGILDSLNTNEGNPVVLGRYTRPEIQGQYMHPHRLFSDRNRDGEFGAYNSQYGLQVKVFAYLYSRGFSISALQLLVASCMAFCLSAAYLILRANKFSGIASAAFAFSLALGPWVIVFARNLYWVQFTWFLPPLVTALSASLVSRVSINRGRVINYLLLGPVLFSVVLAKLLCGYEYITTIYLASLAAFVSLACRSGIRKSLVVRGSLIITLVFILAFATAIGVHAGQLKALGRPGLQTIWDTASKRASSAAPASVVERACGEISGTDLAKCRKIYAASLTANPISVASRYLLVPSFLPWISNSPDSRSLDQADKSALRQIRADLKSGYIQDALRQFILLPPKAWLYAFTAGVVYQLARLVFPVFVILTVAVFWRDLPSTLALGGFFAGSASWFFAAKGHSFIHYHMNYVLWYLLFVPVAVLLIGERLKPDFRSRLALLWSKNLSSGLE